MNEELKDSSIKFLQFDEEHPKPSYQIEDTDNIVHYFDLTNKI